jgi:hypothetical protein
MHLYSANDSEIHDLLISQRQQFTTGVLLELGRSRNIFYSREEERDDLINSPWCNGPFSARSAVERFGAESIGQKKCSVRMGLQSSHCTA